MSKPSEQVTHEPSGNDALSGDEINLLDYLLVLVKYKKMIFLSCVAAFVLACGGALLMSDTYAATARILPSSDEKGLVNGLLGGLSDLPALAKLSSGGSTGDLYVGMLQSRTISDAIIDRFNLMEVFELDSRGSAYRLLDDLVDISVGKTDGIIAIDVHCVDPKLVADMANAYVEELKQLNVRIGLGSAGRQRIFLENRLAVVMEDLTRAEDNLKEFQQKNKAIRIEDQATAVIDAIARLKGEQAGKEVQLGVLLASRTEQNPEVKALREGIAQVREQIRKLEHSAAGPQVSEDIFIGTSEVPELGIQYARLVRDFKVQETLYELLTKQYELAKIEASKNTSTIQVLDNAVVPDMKSGPKRKQIVLMSTFVAGFMAVLCAFLREYGARLCEEDRLRWEAIKKSMLSIRNTKNS